MTSTHYEDTPTITDTLVDRVADALAEVDCEEHAVCFARAALHAVAETHWLVPKREHDQNAAVAPTVRRNGWIHRAAGTSDPDHTRVYAAQLLAAADEVERVAARNAEDGAR